MDKVIHCVSCVVVGIIKVISTKPMKKNIVQDVVFPKRSIRDVELPSRRKEPIAPARPRPKITRHEAPKHEESEESFDEYTPTSLDSRIPPHTPRASYAFDYNNDVPPHKESRLGLWASLAVFIVALGFGVSALFVSAEVSVTPKVKTIPINAPLTASKDRPSGEFGYQVVSVSASLDKTVSAGASAKVEKKASGTIIVYNNASDEPQKLIANTRFESADGKVFRIATPIAVPGRKTENGKKVPGSIEAVVTADQPGEGYNIDLTDFTIPGLKGDPRYTTVYARSKSAMSGGFSGEMKVVEASLEKATQAELEASLKVKLKNNITSQIPVDFILFESGVSYEIQALSQKNTDKTDEASLELKGSAHAVIFDRALLSKAIVDIYKDSIDTAGQTLSVINLTDLTFVLGGNSKISQNMTTPITFTLTGDAKLEWLFDESMLKNDLLGIKKTDLSGLLQAKYPSIESAKVKIRPIWKRSFPVDPAEVTIVKATPQAE